MTPFLLLGLGMAIVLLLVIWLKVHPFLALIIAATVVSFGNFSEPWRYPHPSPPLLLIALASKIDWK